MKPLFHCLLASMLATPVVSAQVIDVEQPDTTGCMASFSQPDLAQSFQPNAENVAGGGIFLNPGSGTASTITIELWDGLPNAGGTLLGSGSVFAAPGTWADAFWPDVAVVPGNTYYLVFESPGSTMCVAGDTGNPYPDGQLYANAGFGSFPTFDFTFRTWFNDIPTINADPPIAGQLWDITVAGLSSGSDFVLIMSSVGAGPVNTPFGIIEVSQPWRTTPRFPALGGSFNWTSTVPSGAAGQTFYMQVVEFELGGETELSNPVALPVF